MKYLRLLGIFLALLLVLAAGLVLAAYGLLATETGSRWLLQQGSQLAEQAGIKLQIGASRGNLLDELQLSAVQLEAADSRVAIEQLTLRWNPRALLQQELHLRLLALHGLRIQPPAATAQPASPPQLPDLRLPLAIRLDRLQIERLVLAQPDGDLALDAIGFGARLTASAWSIDKLEVQGAGLDLAGAVQLTPQPPHRLDGQLSGRAETPQTGKIQAELGLSGSALQPEFSLAVSAPAVLQATGSLDLTAAEPTVRIDASWPRLQWPLHAAPQFTADAGTLQLQGSANAYRLQLATRLQGPELPAVGIRLKARGDSNGLQLEPLDLQLLAGSLDARGSVRWQPEVAWQLRLQARQLNPATHYPDWPGLLGGQVQLDGRIAADGPQLQARIETIEGTLRGQPLQASGELRYRAGQLHAQALQIASGPNRLRLDGRADSRFDLAFDLDAPALATLYPGLAGQMQGQGRLSGSTQAPAVTGRLQGRDLAYDSLRLGEVRLEADWGEQGGQGRLQLRELSRDELKLQAAEVRLNGSLDAHDFQLQVEGAGAQVALAARGGLLAGRWQGMLHSLSLSEPVWASWTLAQPAALALAPERLHSAPLCLAQPRSTTRLCLEGGWSQAQGLDAQVRLSELDLLPLGKYLPGEALVAGRLGGELTLSGPLHQPALLLALRPSDGQLHLTTDDEPLLIPYRDARINARFADDRGSADIALQLGADGRAEGQVTVSPGPRRRLQGQLDASFPDLRLVEGFVPALEAVKGRLALTLALTGSLDQPQASGTVSLLEGSARLSATGLELSEARLQLQGNGRDPMRLSGSVSSGPGRLDLAGRLDPLASGGPALDLRISGQDFQVARLPEAVVLLSPDLQLKGQGPYHLSGRLLVPEARIELKELPAGSVSVSDDEIVLGEEPPPGRGAPRNLTAAVQVALGEAVNFKGFGLTTGLDGALDAAVDSRGTRLHGKIELRDAAYKAYGQDLTVEQGRLLFAGPPANPDVDLKAVRESRDGRVKAYLAMQGPLSKPQPRVYSEPTLPEAEALAYLLTGRGLSQAGRQEGIDIAGAALALGMAKGEPLLQEMGDRLGLDELRFDEGRNGSASSAVILGKYLSPELYLGYMQNLFNPQGAVVLRLRLTERLELESRAGTRQSIDLFYRYEHD